MPIHEAETEYGPDIPQTEAIEVTPEGTATVPDLPDKRDDEQPPKRPGFLGKFAKPHIDGKPRESGRELLGGLWQGAALALVLSGKDVPVGRCMAFQAPVAGAILDKAIEGTLTDKLLVQPLAKVSSRGANITALIGPPLLVGVIERNPQLYGPLKPVLMAMMQNYLVEAWPHIKEMKRKEKQTMRTIQEMQKEGFPDVESLVADMFAPPGYTAEAEAEQWSEQ